MPISKHYGGHGAEVAANMQKQYGSSWKRIFYATENARKKNVVKLAMSPKKGPKKVNFL